MRNDFDCTLVLLVAFALQRRLVDIRILKTLLVLGKHLAKVQFSVHVKLKFCTLEGITKLFPSTKKCSTRPDDGGIVVGSLFLKNVSVALTWSPRSPISSEVQVELE